MKDVIPEPDERSMPTVFDTTTAIVFEGGVTLRKNDDGTWLTESSRNSIVFRDHADLRERYRLRPVVTVDSVEMNGYFYEAQRLVDWRLSNPCGFILPPARQGMDSRHEMNLMYIVGALIHHCASVALEYRCVCNLYCHRVSQLTGHTSETPFFGHPKVFYEIDAYFTVARRFYEMLAAVVWEQYGATRTGRPDRFPKTLDMCTAMPAELRTRLSSSWQHWGEAVKSYRDCINHHTHLDCHASCAWMRKIDDAVWSTKVLLPDNPEVKSLSRFTFELDRDALDYVWQLTSELFDAAVCTLTAR